MRSERSAFSLEALRELVRHMEWADAAVWRALLAHSPAPDDARVRRLLGHLHGVQQRFLAIWTAQPFTFPAHDLDLREIQAWVRPYYARLASTVAGFDETALARPIQMPGLEKYEEQMGRRFDQPTLAETMVQVATHSTYHRGQLNARLRELGGEPPNADYIVWIWLGRPPAEWPADMPAGS